MMNTVRMQKSLWFVASLLMLTLTGSSWAADDAQTRVQGNWLTQAKDGIIQVGQAADGTLQGRIVGGNAPGKLDANNPDPAKRNLALRGQVIMSGLKYDGDGKWSGGTVYKPDEGKSYKCKVELQADDTLTVRGFIGFSLFGKSQIWTRYTDTSMDLPKPPEQP
jgi:uncharacterized protein (DUF2147 family)